MDASDPKQVKKANKAFKVAEEQRQSVVRNLMSTIAGRSFVYDLLSGCHVFATSFALNALQMAHNEGERNVGLKILGDIMETAPESYPLMMREANERAIGKLTGSETADGRTENEHAGTGDGDRGGSDPETYRDPNSPDPHGYYSRNN